MILAQNSRVMGGIKSLQMLNKGRFAELVWDLKQRGGFGNPDGGEENHRASACEGE